MPPIVHNLTIAFLLFACTIAAAQPAATSQPTPQIQPGAASTDVNRQTLPDVSGPPPLQFAFLSGSAAEGKLTIVVPQVLQDTQPEHRTRKVPVLKNGVRVYEEQEYVVETTHYKVVPTTRSVGLKDIFRWNGAAASNAAVEVVQKFIDARVPVILIETPEGLATAPLNQLAIRRGALLVQSPAGLLLAAELSLPSAAQPGQELSMTLPKVPPPRLVMVGRSHGLPPGEQTTLILTKTVPVPFTKQVHVEVESNGKKRTETRQVREIIWKPELEQLQASQLAATDKAGSKWTLQDWQTADLPVVGIDARNRPFDSAYLVPLSEKVIVLTQIQPSAAAQSAPALPQSAPAGQSVAADSSSMSESWVGRTVVPQPNIQLKTPGTSRPLDWRTIGALPWKVTHEKENWVWIGKAWVRKNQVIPVGDTERDRQLIKFGEAVRREPKNAWNYVNRSYFWHDVDNVIADLDAALRLDKDSYIVQARLHALQRAGQWQAALEGWNAQLHGNPQDVEALGNRALILAASPEDRIRNGRQAVADATQAGELAQWKDARSLDALAAAYAETGDFASAIKWKEKANELHKDSVAQPDVALQDKQFVQMLEGPLELYRQGQPYRLRVGGPNTPPPIPST